MAAISEPIRKSVSSRSSILSKRNSTIYTLRKAAFDIAVMGIFIFAVFFISLQLSSYSEIFLFFGVATIAAYPLIYFLNYRDRISHVRQYKEGSSVYGDNKEEKERYY